MPYKNPEMKKRWDRIHNGSRVNSRQLGKRIRIDKVRTYVCEICGLPWKTEFHEYNHDPENLLELCVDCHDHVQNENYIIEQISINTIEDNILLPEKVGMIENVWFNKLNNTHIRA